MLFSTNKLGFSPEFLGRVTLVTSIASLLGIGLYNSFLKEVPLRKIFLVTTVFVGISPTLVVGGELNQHKSGGSLSPLGLALGVQKDFL